MTDIQKLLRRIQELQEENDDFYETIMYQKDVIEGLEDEMDELQDWNEYLERQNSELNRRTRPHKLH